MGLCPVCGRLYCDHSPDERGQTAEEMIRPLTPEEMAAWEKYSDTRGYVPEKIAAARKAQKEAKERKGT